MAQTSEGASRHAIHFDEFFTTLRDLKFGDNPDAIMTVCVFGHEERAHESSVFMREQITKYTADW